MKKISLPLFLILAVASLLWLPNLFAKGMFMDGVYDALFAHNMAQGVSTFWAPQTIYYSQPAYWDNPQLSSFLLSLFYKVLGDAYWVERIYSLSCAIVQLILLSCIWKIYFKESEELKNYAWLPCLLFLVSPLCSWCYSNNLMENTMSVFTTASVLVFLLFLQAGENVLPLAIAGGALIFLGFITKGPVALFPLVSALLFVFVKKVDWKKSLAYMSVQASALILISVFVFSFPASSDFLHHYLEAQLVPALNPKSSNLVSHFMVVYDLGLALLPLLVLAFLSLLLAPKESIIQYKTVFQAGLGFMLLGLSASLPIALSTKQHHYYLLPSLPMFAISFSCFVSPLIKWGKEKFSSTITIQLRNAFVIGCLLVIAGSIFLCIKKTGNYSRDKNLLTDLENIQPLTTNQNVIRADWKFFDQWTLRGYLNRLYDKKICMPDEVATTNFYLTKPNEWGDKLPSSAQRIYSGKTLDLYRTQP